MESKNILNDKNLELINGSRDDSDRIPFDSYRERVILRNQNNSDEK